MPTEVTTVRDSWDWAVVWSAIGGAFLAVIAVIIAVWAVHRGNIIEQNAHDELVHERRRVFELGVLAKLIEVCGHNKPGSMQVVRGLLEVLPPGDLPYFRHQAATGNMVSGPALDEHYHEYHEAVQRRLNDRPARAKRRRR